ncbi:MAG: hypothetical protein ABSA97_15925 [Verrucomicrobiia bacterium]
MFANHSNWIGGEKRVALKTGDYTVEGMEELLALERKNLADIVSCTVVSLPLACPLSEEKYKEAYQSRRVAGTSRSQPTETRTAGVTKGRVNSIRKCQNQARRIPGNLFNMSPTEHLTSRSAKLTFSRRFRDRFEQALCHPSQK